jgi:putative membrane protein
MRAHGRRLARTTCEGAPDLRRGFGLREARVARALQFRVWRQRVISLALLFAGLAAFLWILHANDYRAVLRMVARLGGWLTLFVVLRGLIMVCCGTAWSQLVRVVAAAPVRVMIWLRTVGEGFNTLLPVASVGGDIARAVMLRRYGVDGGAAAASTLADLLMQAAGQAVFMLFGAVLLVTVVGKAGLALVAVGAVGVAALALGGFYAAQRFGGGRLVERGLAWVARRWQADAGVVRLDAPLQAIYADRSAVLRALAWHELGWVIGAVETWAALRLLGVPVSPAAAVVLESLNQGLRSAAFAVPGSLGVQEGGYVALGAVLGIPPPAALALSLVKRVPDLAIGLPALSISYLMQMRRMLPKPLRVPPAM